MNQFNKMKKYVLGLLSACFLLSCSQKRELKKIQVKTNYNVETLAICFEIAEKGFWNFPFEDYQPMKKMARKKFRSYRKEKAIILIDSLVSKGFWLDAMIEVMLKSSSVPNAELMHKIDDFTLKKLSDSKEVANELILEFINALNEFYIKADLENYFYTHKDYYNSVNKEVTENLPPENFIDIMEDYYGKKNNSYTLIPSPTIYHTMGFGKLVKGNTGLDVYNVFGPLKATKDSIEFGYGFDKPSEINELTVHEFGHSFINPVVELEENLAIIDKSEKLFDSIKKEMSQQGYKSWHVSVIEHIVRLGEIRIAYAMNDAARADKIRNHYVKNRKFIYLQELEEIIVRYETNRTKYRNIDAFLPELLYSFETIDKK